MVLVNYSDSESDSGFVLGTKKTVSSTTGTATNPRKRKAQDGISSTSDDRPVKFPPPPPPLPSSFHTLYSTNVRASTSDDPSLHGGRKRQVNHVAGNWPSHVYLEWLPDKPQLTQLDDLVAQVQKLVIPDEHAGDTPRGTQALDGIAGDDGLTLHTFLRTPLAAQTPLHVSLSAPLVVNTSSKDAFGGRLHDAITAAKIGEVVVRAVALDLVSNFDRTRWFLVLRVREDDGTEDVTGLGKLERLLRVCNAVCREWGLAELYKNGMGIGVGAGVGNGEAEEEEGSGGHGQVVDAFHVSVAWMLREVSEEVKDRVRQIEMGVLKKQDCVRFDRVKVKIGNVVEDVLLG